MEWKRRSLNAGTDMGTEGIRKREEGERKYCEGQLVSGHLWDELEILYNGNSEESIRTILAKTPTRG